MANRAARCFWVDQEANRRPNTTHHLPQKKRSQRSASSEAKLSSRSPAGPRTADWPGLCIYTGAREIPDQHRLGTRAAGTHGSTEATVMDMGPTADVGSICKHRDGPDLGSADDMKRGPLGARIFGGRTLAIQGPKASTVSSQGCIWQLANPTGRCCWERARGDENRARPHRRREMS